MIPEDLKYTKDHEWIRIEGSEAVIGITDYAQEALGDITFVELPDVGGEVKISDYGFLQHVDLEEIEGFLDNVINVRGLIQFQVPSC